MSTNVTTARKPLHDALDRLLDAADADGANLALFDIIVQTLEVDEHDDNIVTHTDFRAEVATDVYGAFNIEEMLVSHKTFMGNDTTPISVSSHEIKP
jgi:hypothetical protein